MTENKNPLRDYRDYPFEQFAWDDDPSNDQAWVDAEQAKHAYDNLRDCNDALLKITQEQKEKYVELRKELEYFKEQHQHEMDIATGYARENENLREENSQLKNDLQSMSDNCISLSLHNSRVDALEKQIEELRAERDGARAALEDRDKMHELHLQGIKKQMFRQEAELRSENEKLKAEKWELKETLHRIEDGSL